MIVVVRRRDVTWSRCVCGFRRAVVIPILYTATVMPFEIFFVEDTSVPGWFAADITITVLFFLDMVMNLNVAYFDDAGFPVSKRCAGERL